MATVCYGCGLTVDADGNLVVHTAGTVNTDCTVVNGTPINCNAAGELVGPPEKFMFTGFVVASFGTGELTHFAPVTPVGGTPTVLTGFARLAVVNPSPCLPMNVHLRFGVNHGDFENNDPTVDLNAGGSESRVELIPIYTSSGTTADVFNNQGGHQIWGGAAFESLDSQGSSSLRSHVIPAGGTANFDIGASITVRVYNGNTQLVNYQTFLDVIAYN